MKEFELDTLTVSVSRRDGDGDRRTMIQVSDPYEEGAPIFLSDDEAVSLITFLKEALSQ